MAALYAFGTLAIAAVFVFEILHRHEIRGGLLFIGLITGAATYGLATLRSWARGLGVFVALGMAGLGAVALLSTLSTHRGGKIVPIVLLGASMLVAFVFSTRVFDNDG
jgi:hypothetical protein